MVTRENGYVLNALYATDRLASDINYANGTKRGRISRLAEYKITPDVSDRSIKRGELLYDRMGKTMPKLGQFQQPYVTTILNGATVVEPSKLEDEIRVLGMARKDVEYDAKRGEFDPSDDPVVDVSGLTTVLNTGTDTIRPGDAIEWFMTDPDHRYQIRDGVNYFSPNRLTLGVRPMSIDSSLEVACRMDEAFATMWTLFIEVLLKDVKTAEFLGGKRPDATDPRFDRILHAIQAPIVDAYSCSPGVATLSAAPGRRFDMMVTPMMKIIMKNSNDSLNPPLDAAAAASLAKQIADEAAKVKLRHVDQLIHLPFPTNRGTIPGLRNLETVYNYVASNGKKTDAAIKAEYAAKLKELIDMYEVMIGKTAKGILNEPEDLNLMVWKTNLLLNRELNNKPGDPTADFGTLDATLKYAKLT